MRGLLMETLVLSAFRAMRSLFTPGMFGVFLWSIVVTVAALLGFVILTSVFLSWLAGHFEGGAMATFLPWIGSIGSMLVAWMLFPGIMPIIVSFFDNRIAGLIEGHDYPASLPVQPPAFWPELRHDARFAATAILLNILVLPLYLFPVLIPFVFYSLNGHLLGREFFVMVAKRHRQIADAESLRKRHSRVVMAAGVALAVLATVPILNLFAPFWGIAVMVHLYHRLAGTPDSELLPPGQA